MPCVLSAITSTTGHTCMNRENYVQHMSMSQETSSASSLATTTQCFVYVNLSCIYFASQINVIQKSEAEENQR